ncbi:DUF6541 family protein [Aeromicrobium alkaliterrae]|uniref:Uncharacterized protein n=1 Tax=Aeromicrobium alkaliterrae TaxID=302168 RepID=A0ABN2JDD2_9ACTN
MTWVDLGVAVGVAAALLVLPGLPAAAAAGLRGAWLLGAAVPLSASVLTVAAVAAPRLGLDWSLAPVAAVALGLAVAAGACRLALRRWWDLGPLRAGVEWITVGAAALAGGVLFVRLASALGSPTNVSQTYDGIFHLNAVRWVLDMGDASPATVASMNSDTSTFYPAGFHGLAALTTRLTGVEVPVGVNATWLALAVVAWPIGILLLTRALAGSSRAVLLGAGAVAAALPAFPALLADYGVLYPLLAAYAVLPGALALAVRALAVGADSEPDSGLQLSWLLLAAATVPGVALMHPSALAAWMAIVTPWVLVAGAGYVRRAQLVGRIFWVAASLAWVLGVGIAFQVLRPPAGARFWPPLGTMAQSLGEVLTLAVELGSIALVATVLVWLGGFVVARGPGFTIERRLALLGPVAVFTVLYLVVAGVGNMWVRDTVTGSFYNNSPRVAALLPIVVVPLAALGIARLWQLVGTLGPLRSYVGAPGRRGVVTALVALALLTVVLQGRALDKGLEGVEAAYRVTDTARLLSTDEETLLNRLDEDVPEDAVIVGSPWTGTSLAYALADREVLYTHILMDVTPDMQLLTDELRDAQAGDEICAAAARLNVEYLLDFGRREVQDIGPHPYPGFEYPASSGAFELVDREGIARLYRLTACD